MCKRQSGFTLIEIAVVLTIVGLLVFSVLKGAAMVHQSKLRKTAQMVEDIRTASNLFTRERGRLAGDSLTGIAANGLIDTSTEKKAFKEELILNGYLKGEKDGTNWIWRHALGGVMEVEVTGSKNYIVLTNFTANDLITADDRKFFDKQFDGDGSDSTGPVLFSGNLKISL